MDSIRSVIEEIKKYIFVDGGEAKHSENTTFNSNLPKCNVTVSSEAQTTAVYADGAVQQYRVQVTRGEK